jgi:hypothetical protein
MPGGAVALRHRGRCDGASITARAKNSSEPSAAPSLLPRSARRLRGAAAARPARRFELGVERAAGVGLVISCPRFPAKPSPTHEDGDPGEGRKEIAERLTRRLAELEGSRESQMARRLQHQDRPSRGGCVRGGNRFGDAALEAARSPFRTRRTALVRPGIFRASLVSMQRRGSRQDRV